MPWPISSPWTLSAAVICTAGTFFWDIRDWFAFTFLTLFFTNYFHLIFLFCRQRSISQITSMPLNTGHSTKSSRFSLRNCIINPTAIYYITSHHRNCIITLQRQHNLSTSFSKNGGHLHPETQTNHLLYIGTPVHIHTKQTQQIITSKK